MMIETLDDLFLHTLRDVLYAERRVFKALPKMERKATHAVLKKVISSHIEETERHILRLEEVFDAMGKPARGAKCDAIVGLIDEAEGLMADGTDAETMDAALISLVQAIEHYEIARYTSLVTWARQLGSPEAARLLRATLYDEHVALKVLTKMAERRVNAMAAA